MHARFRTHALTLASLAAAAVLASGCKVSKCKDAQGNEIPNCVTVQTPTKYEGSAKSLSTAWTAGQGLTITSANGEVVVKADGEAGKVSAEFTPFAFEYDADSGKAKLASLAAPTLGAGAGRLDAVAQGSGASGYDVVVHLPAAFDGALDVEQSNGHVEIDGIGAAASTRVVSENGSIDASATLKGTVFVSTKNGGVTVRATPAGAGNLVRSDNGSVALAIVGSADLVVHAIAETGSVTIPDPLPSGWAANGSSPSYTLTLGAGTGALEVSSGNGNVDLSASN